ncbi:uncharacterized protein LOC103570394 [Microplitis demolitor]|uniref:uncharacterized protein LOC103570394 n=1 Tax=Microplitis demolitor TaxID=69319 RepID=UPI0004CDAB83|nr:uncharacterized protein LOC103570394 [Microplitis demolitor]
MSFSITKVSNMLVKWYLICSFIFYFIISSNLVKSCHTQCPKYSYEPYLERIKYLVRLPDHKKLNQLALVGTHSSLSYSINDEQSLVKTQNLNIQQQLKYGVRVLDIGIHPQSNLFEIYTENVDTSFKLSELLLQVDNFLDDNPGEFIIMFIRQVFISTLEVNKSNCDILNYYIETSVGGKRMVKNWGLNDTIGQHRGKILLASLDYSFDDCTLILNRDCQIQNDNAIHKKMKNSFTVEKKWTEIFQNIQRSYNKSYKCYINDLSYWDGVNTRKDIATDGGYYHNNGCPVPLNFIMADNFQKPHRALIIVIADFPPQKLIDGINDSNFHDSSWRSGWNK